MNPISRIHQLSGPVRDYCHMRSDSARLPVHSRRNLTLESCSLHPSRHPLVLALVRQQYSLRVSICNSRADNMASSRIRPSLCHVSSPLRPSSYRGPLWPVQCSVKKGLGRCPRERLPVPSFLFDALYGMIIVSAAATGHVALVPGTVAP